MVLLVAIYVFLLNLMIVNGMIFTRVGKSKFGFRFRGIFLYSGGVLCHVECCITQL